MTENDMKKNFNEEEMKAIMFGYRILSYLKEIVSLQTREIDPKTTRFYNKWKKDIDLVYNTYQKALKLYPDDERAEEWKTMNKRIELVVYKDTSK